MKVNTRAKSFALKGCLIGLKWLYFERLYYRGSVLGELSNITEELSNCVNLGHLTPH